uniref:Uncharacterized protein n=1 Tax=Falco tinnunculus TaxID=100819 RepID=A0A8C4UH81_FALTI
MGRYGALWGAVECYGALWVPQPHGAHGSGRTWRALSLLVALPAVGLCMLNVAVEQRRHPPQPPKFLPYHHLRIRTKVGRYGVGG